MFSFFKVHTKVTPEFDIDLDQFLGFLSGKSEPQHKLFNCGLSDQIRTIRKLNSKKQITEEKSKLPAITPSGTFTKRNKEGIKKHSGFYVFDLDSLGNRADVRKILQTDPYVFLLFDSPSGNGLKFFIKSETDAYRHEIIFHQIKNYLENTYDVIVDNSGSDICRLCYLSWDADYYLNPEATKFEFDKSFKFEKQNMVYNGALHNLTNDELFSDLAQFLTDKEATKEKIARPEYYQWIRISFGLKSLFPTILQQAKEMFIRFSLATAETNEDSKIDTIAKKWHETVPKFDHKVSFLKLLDRLWGFKFDFSKYKEKLIVHKIDVQKYITETQENLLTIFELLKEHKKLAILAPTGAGKTTTCKQLHELFNAEDEMFASVVMVPTIMIAEQFCKSHNCYGLYSGSKTKVEKIYEKNFGVAVYDSFTKKLNHEYFDLAIIDEFHEFVDSYSEGYRKNVIAQSEKCLQDIQYQLYLSGTINYQYCKENNIKIVEIVQKEHQNFNYRVKYLLDESQGKRSVKPVLDYVLDASNETNCIVVMCSSLTMGNVLCEALLDEGIHTEFISSSIKKGNPVYSQIIDKDTIPSEIRVLIVTSFFTTGVNVKNTNVTDVVYVESGMQLNINSIIQFASRFRAMRDVEFTVFLSGARQGDSVACEYEDVYAMNFNVATRICESVAANIRDGKQLEIFDPEKFYRTEFGKMARTITQERLVDGVVQIKPDVNGTLNYSAGQYFREISSTEFCKLLERDNRFKKIDTEYQITDIYDNVVLEDKIKEVKETRSDFEKWWCELICDKLNVAVEFLVKVNNYYSDNIDLLSECEEVFKNSRSLVYESTEFSKLIDEYTNCQKYMMPVQFFDDRFMYLLDRGMGIDNIKSILRKIGNNDNQWGRFNAKMFWQAWLKYKEQRDYQLLLSDINRCLFYDKIIYNTQFGVWQDKPTIIEYYCQVLVEFYKYSASFVDKVRDSIWRYIDMALVFDTRRTRVGKKQITQYSFIKYTEIADIEAEYEISLAEKIDNTQNNNNWDFLDSIIAEEVSMASGNVLALIEKDETARNSIEKLCSGINAYHMVYMEPDELRKILQKNGIAAEYTVREGKETRKVYGYSVKK